MFEKLRIKEHMEVSDAKGRHVGTVDEVKDEMIRLTKSDSMDGKHHVLPLADVDKIEENRVYLKEDAKIPIGLGNKASVGL
ncbi:MAG: hypothetical protein APF78_04095 [Sphingomonadales bacterium BRH_c3]|nr:MAG: hypothetical protein APF78_04095 [Sphingomonadales bacterium BRH_c3]